MSSFLSQFSGGAIKSTQRGVISLVGTVASGTAALSPAVDTAKSHLRFLGVNAQSDYDVPLLALTNSTTVTATRAGTFGTVSVSWELTEYY